MADPKTTSSRQAAPDAKRRRPAKAMPTTALTTAFTAEAGAAFPKGAARITFSIPGNAANVLTGTPTKVKPLLQRYGEAVAKSREAGRRVSFRVDVDPDGGATVTPVEETAAGSEAFPAEEPAEPTAELKDALAAARERGRLQAAEILNGEDMLSAEAFAQALGTTRMTVNTKRQNGQLLGLAGAKRGFRFPVWQLDAEGKPYPEIPALLEQLGTPWAVYRFLVQPQGSLDGLSGREALERGKGRAAVMAAQGIARGDFR